MRPGRIRQAIAVSLLAVALMWPVAGDRIQAALSPNAGGCEGAGKLPDPDNIEQARAAILCLLNKERAAVGLPPLRENGRLEDAAQDYAVKMGERGFFDHVEPDGTRPEHRIAGAGYSGRGIGENLYWGTRESSTPAAAVAGWMNSPGHRANILRPEWTEVGTGIGYDAPRALVYDAAVYVNEFGG